MLVQSMSDLAIGKAIGRRFQELRLRRNMSLTELSNETGTSRQTLHLLLNQGKGNLATVIAVARALGDLESLCLMLAEVPLSPIQLLKLHGVQRQRASGVRKNASQDRSPERPSKDLDW
jgi:putative transcriptional regulator